MRKTKALAAARRLLGGEMTGDSTLETTFQDHPVSFRAGSTSWSLTVSAGRFPIALDLFKRELMRRVIKPKSNVVFAEDALNRHYFAEATPAVLVADVLDGELGRRVAERRPSRILVKPGTIELTDGYRYYGVNDATVATSVELLLDLSRAFSSACKKEPAFANRDARLYRDDGSMVAAETALVKRSSDVAAALERQKSREIDVERTGKLAVTASAIFLVLFFSLVAFLS